MPPQHMIPQSRNSLGMEGSRPFLNRQTSSFASTSQISPPAAITQDLRYSPGERVPNISICFQIYLLNGRHLLRFIGDFLTNSLQCGRVEEKSKDS